MSDVRSANGPQSLFELSWIYAQDAKFAIDADSGIVVDVNLAAESLMGCSRVELIGKHTAMLHPEAERERVKVEFRKAAQKASPHPGFHIQRKDGSVAPVAIWSSESLKFGSLSIMIMEFRDISEVEQREHLLATKTWASSAYAGAALALGRKQTPESLLEAICAAITGESAYLLAWVGVAEDGPAKPVRIAAVAGSAKSYMDGLTVSWSEDELGGQGPTGLCIRSGQLQIVEDTETSTVYGPWRERGRQVGVRSSLSIPFVTDGKSRGALVVYAAHPRAFEPAAIDVFVHLAEQIGHGMHAIEQDQLLHAERVHLAKVQTQLTEALSAMVAPIVLAMEMRDPYTVGHQSRVAEIAVAIGREMGWPEERLQGLRVAAQVHDIGKISIPAEILTKPGKLNPAERAMIFGHSETGFTILKDIPFAWPIAEIVRQHHEKLDGSGYPRGLKGDEILPEAKILTVADIVEAMGSYRPYRSGIKLNTVLREIERQAGSLLDTEVVRICVSLFRQKHFMVPGWIRR
ncbi:MAG: HD domain-containing phosphohydrolase [Terracidiphilus sp.]|jgi:PAS domain S-box-containing protein/putative nucleotidyltransferase with HDIG domain